MIPQKRHAPSFHQPVLRLAGEPPEIYDVAPALSFAEAKARQEREHREWVAAVFSEHKPWLVWYIFKKVEDFHFAEDLVQQTFVKLLETPRERIRWIRRWLICTCKFYAVNEYSKQLRQKTKRCGDLLSERAPVWVAKTQKPSDIAQYHELKSAVESEIERHPERRQKRLRLRIFDEVDYGDSEAFGAGRSAVYSDVAPAIKELQKKFADVRPKNKPFRLKLRRTIGELMWHRRRMCFVRCVELGRDFEDINEAAAFLRVDRSAIQHALCAPATRCKGYHFIWKERTDGPKPVVLSAAEIAYRSRGKTAAPSQA